MLLVRRGKKIFFTDPEKIIGQLFARILHIVKFVCN